MKRTAFLLAAAAIATPSQAQDAAPPAPAPPPSEPASTPGRNPAVTYLVDTLNISEQEAQRRIAVQNDVIALTNRIEQQNDPAFASVTIQQVPEFKVIIRYADGRERPELLQGLSTALAGATEMRAAKRARSAIRSNIDAINVALRAARANFAVGYDTITERFVIDAESDAVVSRLRTLIPASFRQEVDFNVRPLPVPQQVSAPPTGFQPGDHVNGGFGAYTSRTNQACTLAFAVTYGASNTRGILTAGHCTTPKEINVNNRRITFPRPAYSNTSGANDYAIYETTGLSTTFHIYFSNTVNRIPEFPSSGWLNTRNFIRGFNQVNGMVICKSGVITGLTCGSIVDEAYAYRPGVWFIKVSHTRQYDISAPGDSGAPWFLYPGSSSDITAAGIHTAGSGTGPNSIAVYMPIDRAFDHVANVRLLLRP